MRLTKWGDSLAVRIPASLVEAFDLKAGDDVGIVITDPLRPKVCEPQSRAERLLRLRKFRGLAPAEFRFDRPDTNTRD
jgi:antitoxin MazE